MSKFKVGDRVLARGHGWWIKGVVVGDKIQTRLLVEVTSEKFEPEDGSLVGKNIILNHKQCRRLVKKKDRIPDALAEHLNKTMEDFYENYKSQPMEHGPCGSGPVAHVHLHREKYGYFNECPVESCSWGKPLTQEFIIKDKAVEHRHECRWHGRDSYCSFCRPSDKCPNPETHCDKHQCNSCSWGKDKAEWCVEHGHKKLKSVCPACPNPTPKPAPREWWIAPMGLTAWDSFHAATRAETPGWIRVVEVLPDDKGER